jgi:hypothetical protein
VLFNSYQYMPYNLRRDIDSWVDAICTCDICANHNSAKECVESDCKCCGKENHSMIMDGMEGFVKPNSDNEKAS